jgi:pimeloyl-ACP methyl ester carboxylesterase
MSKLIERTVKTNGISLNVVEQGQGPLVLLCHGFPESWCSWRHQIDALAADGFHAVAPDMRGYGKSDRPEAIDQYTMLHFVGDLVGLLDGLEAPRSVVVGHDWAHPSRGRRRVCARTASARSLISASRTGRVVQCTRPA